MIFRVTHYIGVPSRFENLRAGGPAEFSTFYRNLNHMYGEIYWRFGSGTGGPRWRDLQKKRIFAESETESGVLCVLKLFALHVLPGFLLMSDLSTPDTSPSSSLPSSAKSLPLTPPNLHQNSIDPSSRWLVQKFGGTSIGKFPVRIAQDIISCIHFLFFH
jgi:hypothetical protein